MQANKHNGGYLDHARRHVRELETLYKISQLLASGTQQRQIFAELLDILDKELDMNSGVILLLSTDNHQISVEIGHNIPDKMAREASYRKGEGITGRVVEEGRPIVVPEISKEPDFLDRLKKQQDINRELSFICVPVKIGNEVIGAISVFQEYRPEHPLEEDLRVLSIIAGMIAYNVKSQREAATERKVLEAENLRLRSELEDKFRPENIIGNSNAMRMVYRAIHQVAASDTSVLIRGESGTGKELVAHAIHYSSPRARGPFVKVNCAALSENLLESELFGHEKGAFTGATQTRVGRLEEADGGTLFLDEIGDFSPAIQVKLLRVLQEKEFERVGSNKRMKVNIRVICATNRDLEKAVSESTFRQDLYYRINVFPIYMPPLRERKDDILLLSDFFVEQYSEKMGKDVRRISTPAINMMVAYHWPGNVRELENSIERAVLLSDDNVIHGHHLPPTLQTSDASDTIGMGSFEEKVALFERDLIVDALKRNNGNLSGSARDLQTTDRILRYKVKNLEIDHKKYRRKT